MILFADKLLHEANGTHMMSCYRHTYW